MEGIEVFSMILLWKKGLGALLLVDAVSEIFMIGVEAEVFFVFFCDGMDVS